MYKGHREDSRSLYDFCSDVAVDPRVVVDLGAHRGDGYRQLRRMYPDAVIHLVEPMQDCVDAIMTAVEGDSSTIVHSCAIGRHESTMLINSFPSDDRQSSNFYSDRGGRYGKPTQVPVRVMSYEDLPRRINLAKINIEAGEFDLLQTDFFDRIDSFVMEAHNNLIPGKTWVDVVQALETKFDMVTTGDLNYKYCFVLGLKNQSLSG